MSLLEIVGSILTELEKVHQKLDRLLASGGDSVMGHPITYTNEETKELLKEPKKENTTEEEFEQDFSQALVMKQTELALLLVKKGYQQWLAKSLIKGGGKGYDNGNTYDFVILEISPKSEKPTKWVFKKWKPFEVFKD